jgi:hypothetical protein
LFIDYWGGGILIDDCLLIIDYWGKGTLRLGGMGVYDRFSVQVEKDGEQFL